MPENTTVLVRGLRACVLLTVVLTTPAAWADKWALASKKVVESPNHQVRATILPREVASQIAYFEEADKVPQPGQLSGGATQAQAIVEVREAEAWHLLWKGPLENDVAPVEAMLADDGRLVTFDNWHSIGYGRDVIVVYDAKGAKVRSLSLRDFLPKPYIDTLPRSVSSRYWQSGDARFSPDQSKLELEVVIPGVDLDDRSAASVPFELVLGDGSMRTRDKAAFDRASATGDRLDAERREEQRKWQLARQVPWPSPRGKDEAAWEDFVHEIGRRRMVDFSTEDYLIPAKGSEDHQEWVEIVDGIIDQISKREGWEDNGPQMFASYERGEAARILLPALRRQQDKAWRGVTLVYVGESEFRAPIETEVHRLGATFLFVDVDKPLPPASPQVFQDEESED